MSVTFNGKNSWQIRVQRKGKVHYASVPTRIKGSRKQAERIESEMIKTLGPACENSKPKWGSGATNYSTGIKFLSLYERRNRDCLYVEYRWRNGRGEWCKGVCCVRRDDRIRDTMIRALYLQKKKHRRKRGEPKFDYEKAERKIKRNPEWRHLVT